MYLAGLYVVNLASKQPEDRKQLFQMDEKVAKNGLFVSGIYFIFLLITVIDNLQRKGIILGNPVLAVVPGYNWFISVVCSLSQSISGMTGFILPEQIKNIVLGNLFYVLIPLLLYKLLGYRFGSLISFKNTRASWPIVGIYLIMFFISGITVNKAWGFVYSLLYPAICEEFFHRGIIFRSASSIFRGTVVALAAGTIAYSLMHFPDYFFRIYEGSLLITLSNMGNVFLFGLLMAYGYRKTGTLLPWILVHALSDALYLEKFL